MGGKEGRRLSDGGWGFIVLFFFGVGGWESRGSMGSRVRGRHKESEESEDEKAPTHPLLTLYSKTSSFNLSFVQKSFHFCTNLLFSPQLLILSSFGLIWVWGVGGDGK